MYDKAYLRTKRQKLRSSGSGSYSIYTTTEGVYKLWLDSCTVLHKYSSAFHQVPRSCDLRISASGASSHVTVGKGASSASIGGASR